MCGLVGIWNTYKLNNNSYQNILKRMIKPLKNRGPDDEGIWSQDFRDPGFAHCRLSIQDLSNSGHQPMVSSNGRYVIVFNGEIYNHFEIRNELEKIKNFKISWRGKSDTETLISAIECWPIEKVLNKINGMFAFAFWDRKDRRLTIARDRFGEKPLYYGFIKTGHNQYQQSLVFGSELSFFKGLNEIPLEINSEALSAFFQYGYVPSHLSIYSGIRKMLPGHLLKIECDKNSGFSPRNIPNEIQWYKIMDIAREGFFSQELNLQDSIIQLEKTLLSSVNYQTISDAPLGTFLSGGIDSTLITALLQTQQKNAISSFTISFPDDKYGENKYFNEAPFAKSVAKYLGTKHTEIALTYKDAQNLIPNLSRIYSEPFADSSQVPTSLVCSEAKKAGLSVMLSGDGGDELFGGYNRHSIAPLINRYFSRIPSFLKYFLAESINKIPIKDKGFNKDKKQKLYKALNNSQNINSIYNALVSLSYEKNLPLKNALDSKNQSILNSIPDTFTSSEQIMLRDVINYLPSDLLVKIDRAAMYVSLETRAPFLDYRVAELAWSLPLKYKIKRKGFRYQGKWILREILKKYVPKEIIERPKCGFAMPIGSWLKGPLKDWADDLLDPGLIANHGYLDSYKVRKLWDQHLNGNVDNTSEIWTILMWQSWVNEWK